MRILCIGDIVGKPGRTICAEVLPALRAEKNIDLVVANVENAAHGNGVTDKAVHDISMAGADVFTSGNHIWKNARGVALLHEPSRKLLRPQNYDASKPGSGLCEITVGTKKVLVMNYIGQVFMRDEVANPFAVVDADLKNVPLHDYAAVVVDFHAEATSEKIAFGWHLDGRASIVFGTHTHVATKDSRILPHGTAVCSDVGMTGARDGVLGVSRRQILEEFQGAAKSRYDIEESRPYVLNAVMVDVDSATRKALSVEHLDIVA